MDLSFRIELDLSSRVASNKAKDATGDEMYLLPPQQRIHANPTHALHLYVNSLLLSSRRQVHLKPHTIYKLAKVLTDKNRNNFGTRRILTIFWSSDTNLKASK